MYGLGAVCRLSKNDRDSGLILTNVVRYDFKLESKGLQVNEQNFITNSLIFLVTMFCWNSVEYV